MRLSLAILTLNEIPGLRATLANVPFDAVEDVFAVDASSVDGTVEFLRSHGVPVHPQRRPGLGAAMLQARELAGDGLIFFHPDGNEDPRDVTVIARMLREGAPFVVASRMLPGAWNEEDDSALRPRKWANQGLALLAHVLFNRHGVRFTDITNGLRGIRCEVFDQMWLDATDLTMDFQMIIRALKLGIPIAEFPTREGPRIGGQTHFESWPTGKANLRRLWSELRLGNRPLR